MKKTLIAIPVVLALLAGILYYQRQQVAGDLQALLQGKTYSSYGIKIEILPNEGAVQGWLRPTIQIPQVKVDLSAWGFGSLELENAAASRELWSQESIHLELPKISLADKYVLTQAYAELTAQQMIASMGSQSLRYQNASEGACLPEEEQEAIEVLAPHLKLGPWQGSLPEKMEISWQGIQASCFSEVEEGNLQEESGREKDTDLDEDLIWRLGPMRLALDSHLQEQENIRRFEIVFQQKGGEYRGDLDISKIQDFELRETGQILELDEEKQEEVRQEITQIKKLGLEFLQPLPTNDQTPVPEYVAATTKKSKAWEEAIKKILSLSASLNLEFHEGELHWGGLQKMTPVEGGPDYLKFLISPLSLRQKNTFTAESFAYELSVEVEKLEYHGLPPEQETFLLQGIKLQDQANYRGLKFRDLLKDYLEVSGTPSLSSLLFGKAAQLFIKPRRILSDLLSYLSYYPNEKNFSLSIRQVDYEFASYVGKHKDSHISYYLKPQSIGYELGSDFDIRYQGPQQDKPKAPYEKGQARLAMELKIPWEKLLKLSRQVKESPETYPQLKDSLAALLAREETRYNFDVQLDLGKNYFDFTWDSEAVFPLGEFLNYVVLPKDAIALQKHPMTQEFMRAFEKTWLEKGSLEVKIKIDRWTKFQEFLAMESPQSVFGLALLTPYGKIDGESDSFSVHLEYKDKKLLLNGEPNENLNKILEPFLSYD